MSIGSHEEWMEIAEARNGSAGHDKERCIGVFYDRAVQDKKATREQGRAVYKTVAYVEILIPGAPHQRPNERAADWPGPSRSCGSGEWLRSPRKVIERP